MKHFQKYIIYLFVLTINFLFIQTDLLSQNDSFKNQDSLLIGGIYKVTLISGEVILGEIQSYDSVTISILLKGNVLNINKDYIRSIEIPTSNYSTESSLKIPQRRYPYWAIGIVGGGISPVGHSFGKKYGFSGSIGSDFIYHIQIVLGYIW